MKVLFTITVLFLSLSSVYSQTYYFSELTVSANVETSRGTENRVIDEKKGPFKFVFETSSASYVDKLFTVYEPGMEYNPNYFTLVENQGYKDFGGVLFKECYYYSTKSETGILVLIANDNSRIVIYEADSTIYDYKK